MGKKSSPEFDLCVAGCGPGGLAGAMRVPGLGPHTVIIESGQIGGAGVMWAL